jgi:hypothetical protein
MAGVIIEPISRRPVAVRPARRSILGLLAARLAPMNFRSAAPFAAERKPALFAFWICPRRDRRVTTTAIGRPKWSSPSSRPKRPLSPTDGQSPRKRPKNSTTVSTGSPDERRRTPRRAEPPVMQMTAVFGGRAGRRGDQRNWRSRPGRPGQLDDESRPQSGFFSQRRQAGASRNKRPTAGG